MFDLFDFDLPGAVTEQLRRKLDRMQGSQLTQLSVKELALFQRQHRIRQGVYQLLYSGQVAYVGKASDAKVRLEQHFWKAQGRLNLQTEKLDYKCLLLHPNWSTSANEELLIQHYQNQGSCLWNLSGFGAKDVGRQRDGTEPNKFDSEYPINADYPVSIAQGGHNLGELLQNVKNQLPYIFRYGINDEVANKTIDLTGVPLTTRMILTTIVRALGADWQATVFFSHIILYKERRNYEHGVALLNKA